MANNANINSTILSEHRKIVGTRYVLATLNFVAVLLGMLVTLFFVSRRGIYDAVLTVMWVLIVINAIQIALCLGEYILRVGFGINIKFLPVISYAFGGLWVIALVLEMVFATLEAGTLRTDLLIVAIIQAVVAIVAYILWPNLDRRAIDSMIKPSSRGDEKKRAKKAKRYVATYGVLTVLIVLAQAATLLLYKMPPTFYDLFADNRALQYELNEDKDGYIVSAVYNGTSPYVNIPATYNNLPVVGIKSGALVDDGIIEKYKITSITFGTPEKDEEGNEVLKSNLQFINSGAIVCSRVESLSIPESVTAIEDGAIRGDAIRTIEYSSRANFDYSIIAGCPNLARVLMSGEHVGAIASLEGMPERVNIQVDKDIYNAYRAANLDYVSSFSPILADDEFCIDFFTGCDYYIDSIFAKKGETVKLTYASLKNDKATGVAPSVDTLAYIRDAHELGTDGAKADSAFRGWYYDGNYVAKVDFTEFGEISLTESSKIYAKWVNEYNAELNWGTYKPAGQVDKVYWTTEDLRSFPVVTDRNGYSRGVVWTKAGTDEKLTNSDGITESIALNATWQFDAPTISLDYVLNGGTETITVGGATFTYDEYKMLQLSAVHSHALESDQINNTVDYDYEWYKDGVKIDEFSNTDIVRLQNVVESGVYTLRVTATPHHYADQGTYAEVNYNVQIAKKSLDLGDVTFNYLSADKHFTYNGGMQSCVITGNVATPGVGVTYAYSNDNGYSSNSGMTNAGDYSVIATFAKVDPAEAENYAVATLTTRATVKPIVLATPTWSQGSFVYDKAEHAVYISFAEAIAGEDVGVVYEGASATNAGNYTAIVTDITNTNYTRVGVDANLLSCSWTISPRTVYVQSWTLNGSSTDSVTYTGAEHRVEAVVSGVMNGDEHVSFSYEGSTMAATNVGTYVAAISGLNDSNYTFDDTAEFEWAITPARLTVTFDSHGNPTYNGGAQGIYATVSGIVAADVDAFTATDFDTSDTSATLSISLAAGENANSLKLAFSATNAATYEAKINGLLSGAQHLANYVIDTAAEDSFSITPKLLNVRPVDGVYTYNGQEQHMLLMVEGVIVADRENITFTIGEGGDKVDDVTHGVFIDYVGRNAGSYPTSVTEVNDTNYSIIPYTQSLTINKKVVTIAGWTVFDNAENEIIAWNGNGYEYNKAGYKLGYTLAGAVEGENVTLALANAEQVDASASFYTTTATLADDNAVNENYSFAGDSAQWKINPKPITLTWKVDNGSQTSFVYSKSEHNAAYTINGIIEGDEINLTYKSGEAALTATGAGNYKVTVESIDNSNYRLDDSSKSFSWSITPKPITVGWRIDELGTDIKSVVYKAGNYTVNPEFYGLMDGDSTSVNYDIAKNQHTRSDAGNYTVLATGLSNANYTIGGGSSEFNWTIRPLTIEVIWDGQLEFAYNSQNQHPTATVTNLCGTDSINLTYTNYGKNVGSYEVTIDTLDNGNYTLTGATGVTQAYKIEKLPVSISWASNREFTYNAQNQYPVATITNRCFGDEITITYDGIASDAGNNYTVSISEIDNENYTLIDADGDLSCDYVIKQRPVTLSWEYSSIVYNAGVQYPRATVISNVYGQTVNVDSYDGDVLVAKNVGSYSVEAKTLSNANFTFDGYSNVSHEYSIEKRVLGYDWYAWQNGSRIELDDLEYNGKAYEIRVELDGVCPNDVVNASYDDDHNFITSAGDYVVTVQLSGSSKDNYTFPADFSADVTINPQPVKITWAGATNVIYDKNGHSLIPTVTGIKADDDNFEVDHTVKVDGNLASNYKNAGTYVHVLELTDPNYTLVNCEGFVTNTLVIDKCTVSVVWGTTTFTYDGGIQIVDPIVSITNSPEGVSYENYYDLSGNGATNAGSQDVIIKLNDTDNFVFVGGGTQKTTRLTILPQSIEVEWVIPKFTYDGTPKTVTATSPYTAITLSNETQTAAGTYEVIATSDNNNYVVTNNIREYVIERAALYVTWDGDSSIPYDGGAHTLTARLENKVNPTVVPGFTYSYRKNGASVYYYDVKNAGDYTVIANINSDVARNYEIVDGSLEASLKITKAKISVSWNESRNEITYDGISHAITATIGNVSGTNVTPSASYSYQHNGNVVYSLINASDYLYTATVSLNDTTNYEFEYAHDAIKTFKIVPVIVSVSWANEASKIPYDGASHSLNATLEAANGIDVSYGYKYNGQEIDAVTAAREDAYIVSVFLRDTTNFMFASDADTDKELTIEKRLIGIDWNHDNQNHTYRVSGYDFNAVPTNVVSGDDVSFVFSGSTRKYNANESGYIIRIIGLSGTNSENYKLPENGLEKTYVINPQPVVINWYGLDTEYNGVAQAPALEIVGKFDTTVDVEYIPFIGHIDADEYDYSVTLNNTNYTLDGCDGNTSAKMVISKIELTVAWQNLSQTYGEMSYGTVFATLSGVLSIDDVDVSVTGYDPDSKAGNYDLVATLVGEDSKNYTFSATTKTEETLVVNRQVVQAIWWSSSVAYDGEEHAPVLTVNNSAGESLSVSTIPGAISAGTHKYKASNYFIDTENYELLDAECDFTISPRTIRVNSSAITVAYDATEQKFVVTFADVLDADADMVEPTLTIRKDGKLVSENANITESGIYSITVGLRSVPANYTQAGSAYVTVTVEVLESDLI